MTRRDQKLQEIVNNLNFRKTPIETLNATTFRHYHDVGQHRGNVVAEIGDINSPHFKPHIKLNKWENEAVLEVGIDEAEEGRHELVNDRVIFHTSKKEYHFYLKTPETVGFDKWYEPYVVNEQGGMEFEVVLKEKPETNVLNFYVNTQNLDFFYQPILTDEERNIMETTGDFARLEHVEGSYAVYHKEKINDHTGAGGKNYGCGKAFHILRPKVIDANGKSVWAELKFNEKNNQLAVVIPQDFLDAATYPVVVDPTFGYTTAGGSNVTILNTIRGSTFTPSTGVGNSVYLYINKTNLTKLKAAMYDQATLAFTANSSTVVITDRIATTWESIQFAMDLTLPTANVILAAWADSTGCGAVANFYFDAGAANQGTNRALTFADAWPDPLTVDSNDTNQYSIYVAYSYDPTMGIHNEYRYVRVGDGMSRSEGAT